MKEDNYEWENLNMNATADGGRAGGKLLYYLIKRQKVSIIAGTNERPAFFRLTFRLLGSRFFGFAVSNFADEKPSSERSAATAPRQMDDGRLSQYFREN